MSMILGQMSEEQRFLIQQAMTHMDQAYDEEADMLASKEEGEARTHSTRGSAHYALGLLLRGEPGDLDRACRVIERVLDMQFDHPDEIYHGTFRMSPQAPLPPVGQYPWRSFGQGHAYFLNHTLEQLTTTIMNTPVFAGQEDQPMRDALDHAVEAVLPVVWRSYDPNWREFIACAFAVVLALFETDLPVPLIERMDQAMERAVTGSIERRIADEIPMNTNIELMHIFICDYYGSRMQKAAWLAHVERVTAALLADVREFGTFAEFNSTTYYGVDLTALGLIRQYGKTEAVVAMGRELEAGLWRNIARLYHADLENLSGPFSRAYEMDMLAHSSMGVLIYLALGQAYQHLTAINCESEHDSMIALVGVQVPSDVLAALRTYQGERNVEQSYRELCERHKPGERRYVCTATAWVGARSMLGALSGSRNTSGQLHPLTMHWLSDTEDKYSLRLLRRIPGGEWSSHMRGVTFEATASKGGFDAVVDIEGDQDLEIFFDLAGPNIDQARITQTCWELPGLVVNVEADAPAPLVRMKDEGMEIVYVHRAASRDVTQGRMRFKLSID